MSSDEKETAVKEAKYTLILFFSLLTIGVVLVILFT